MISAVNSDFELGNIYCFRYRVKLNNPLMGTEIIVFLSSFSWLLSFHVKLNNPLMGTEIVIHARIIIFIVFIG